MRFSPEPVIPNSPGFGGWGLGTYLYVYSIIYIYVVTTILLVILLILCIGVRILLVLQSYSPGLQTKLLMFSAAMALRIFTNTPLVKLHPN